MIELDVLLPRLALAYIDGVQADGERVRVSARTRDGLPVLCPRCATASVREHSRYTRHVTDEAVGGRPVVIDLSVRRFYCRTIECPQATFGPRTGVCEPSCHATPGQPVRSAGGVVGVSSPCGFGCIR